MMLASSSLPSFHDILYPRRSDDEGVDSEDDDTETSPLNDVLPPPDPLGDRLVATMNASLLDSRSEGDGAVSESPESEAASSLHKKDLAVQRITLMGEFQKALKFKSSSLSPTSATKEDAFLLDQSLWRCFPASCAPTGKPLVSALKRSSRSGRGNQKVACNTGGVPSLLSTKTSSPTKRRVRGLWNDKCTCLFTQLHDDMMLFIFSYLSMWDMTQSSHVCRRWKYLTGLDQAWKNVEATDFLHEMFRRNPMSTPEHTSQILDSHLKHRKSESLTIRSIEYRLTASILLPNCFGLLELTLTGYADLTDTHVHVMLLSSQPVLHHGKGCYNAKGNTLRKLVLEYCPLLTNATVRSIALTCPQLEYLSLRGNRQIDSLLALRERWNTKSDSIARSGSTHVLKLPNEGSQRPLALPPMNFSGPKLAASPTMTDLSSLFAPPPQARPPTESSVLRMIPGRRTGLAPDPVGRLVHLDVSGTRVTPDAILGSLDVSSSTVRSQSKALVKLESLLMSGSGELWSDEHMALLSHRIDLNHLRVLKLDCANPYGASSRLSSLDALLGKDGSSSSPLQLQRLSLAGHSHLTAKTVAQVCARTPHLQELQLGGCRSIGTSPEVELHDMACVLGQLASTSLVHLSMARCFAGERQLRLAISTEANALVEEESQVSTFLSALMFMAGRKLQELDVSGWWAISTDEEAQLRQSFPGLKKLHLANTRCAREQVSATTAKRI